MGCCRMNDVENARLFIRKYGHIVRYCPQWKSWIRWDRNRWVKDEENKVVTYIITFLDEKLAEAEGAGNTAVADWYRHCKDLQRIRAIQELAQPYQALNSTDLDHHDHLLNLQNGILNLQTLELQPHDRNLHSTKIANAEYAPDANSAVWNKFIERVIPNPDVREYVQRCIGYALTGRIREQYLFVLYGPESNNGKTTFIRAVTHAIGDYALISNSSLLLKSRGDSVRTDIARLQGARLVASSEVASRRQLDTVITKQLTGGDKIVARRLYEHEQEIRPTWKLFLICNNMPEIAEMDQALYRRLRIIPFNEVLSPDEIDLSMGDRLEEAAPAVLNWAIEGYKKWLEGGIGYSDEVQRLTGAYVREQDSVLMFLETRCTREENAKVTKGRFYHEYVNWSTKNGYSPVTKHMLGTVLKSHGIMDVLKRDGSGTNPQRFWIGIRTGTSLKVEERD